MGREHFVKQGECLSGLAKRYGFVDYQTIYDHPQNAGLKAERQNPNVLYPGDVVFIPDNELREVDAGTEQRHRFQLRKNHTLFRLIVEDSDERPFANVRYELSIDKQNFEGMTDAEGKLEEMIPADARSGALVLFSDEGDEPKVIGMFSLNLGHLDPVEKTTGVQSRLNNLGFHCGKVDGILGPKTAEALREFQEKHALPVSGEVCSATREQLRRIHDWQ